MTTSYERLREECNKGLPERYADERVSITDVLRVLNKTDPTRGLAWFAIDDDGKLLSCDEYNTGVGVGASVSPIASVRFTLSLPLSAPENEAACEAVLKLLDSEKDRVFVCREGDDYANCL